MTLWTCLVHHACTCSFLLQTECGILEQCYPHRPCGYDITGERMSPPACDTIQWLGRSLQSQLCPLMREAASRLDSVRRRGCQCVKCGWLCGSGVSLPTQAASLCGPGGRMRLPALCAFWCCQGCVVIVDCLWTSGRLPVVSQHFIKNGCAWGTKWGCSRAPPSGLASGHWSIYKLFWL